MDGDDSVLTHCKACKRTVEDEGSNPSISTWAIAQLAEYRIVYPVVAGSNPVGLAVVVVAQSVERRIVVPKVEGSSPFNHPLCTHSGRRVHTY